MRMTIDNLDGLGALDYSPWISAEGPLKVKRTLNAPSTCTCLLELGSAGLAVPARRGRVIISRDDGTVLFTGYIATEPEPVYAGCAITGAAYRLLLDGVSDEWLLDRQGLPTSGTGLAQNGAEALGVLTNRVSLAGLTLPAPGNVRSVGFFQPEQDKSWSQNAGGLASSVYAAYRVIAGVVGLEPAGTVSHAFSDADGSLQLGALRVSQTRELANDVTVSGEMEPGAYISESFAGDGTTSVFTLSGAPFRNGSQAGRLTSSRTASMLRPLIRRCGRSTTPDLTSA